MYAPTHNEARNFSFSLPFTQTSDTEKTALIGYVKVEKPWWMLTTGRRRKRNASDIKFISKVKEFAVCLCINFLVCTFYIVQGHWEEILSWQCERGKTSYEHYLCAHHQKEVLNDNVKNHPHHLPGWFLFTQCSNTMEKITLTGSVKGVQSNFKFIYKAKNFPGYTIQTLSVPFTQYRDTGGKNTLLTAWKGWGGNCKTPSWWCNIPEMSCIFPCCNRHVLRSSR